MCFMHTTQTMCLCKKQMRRQVIKQDKYSSQNYAHSFSNFGILKNAQLDAKQDLLIACYSIKAIYK